MPSPMILLRITVLAEAGIADEPRIGSGDRYAQLNRHIAEDFRVGRPRRPAFQPAASPALLIMPYVRRSA